MTFFNFFKKSPAQRARKTRLKRYGSKGVSIKGLKRISKANRRPETKISIQDKRLVLSHKPMKKAA